MSTILFGSRNSGDSVAQNASQLMERLKDSNVVPPQFNHITGKSQPGRAGAHDRYSYTVGWSCFRYRYISANTFVVGCKPLKMTNGYRLFFSASDCRNICFRTAVPEGIHVRKLLEAHWSPLALWPLPEIHHAQYF